VVPGGAGPRAALVLERAAQALELGRMIERDDTALQLRVHGGFLLDLLDDRLGSEAAAVARLRGLGVGLGAAGPSGAAAYVGAVARLRTDLLDAGPPPGPAQRQMVRLTDRVHAALATVGANGLVGVLDGAHVGVLVTEPEALDGVARALVALEPEAVLAAGPVVDRLAAAAGSLRSARVVADVAATMAPVDGCVRQADIRLPGLLVALRDDPRVQEFVESELGALLEHEARTGSGLVELLRQFLAVGGNKTELARVAHRNRTSLYPALRRLEQLVGHPLDDPASRLSLGVALLAHDQARS
jgi:purine catabolism regulator